MDRLALTTIVELDVCSTGTLNKVEVQRSLETPSVKLFEAALKSVGLWAQYGSEDWTVSRNEVQSIGDLHLDDFLTALEGVVTIIDGKLCKVSKELIRAQNSDLIPWWVTNVRFEIGPSFEITVARSNGESFAMTVFKSTSVHGLKEMIQERFEIPVAQQTLFHGGRILSGNELKLQDFDIGAASELEMRR